MADEFEDYIFENKRNAGRDFALANGDVTSVLRGLKVQNTVLAPSKRRSSYLWNGAAARRARIGVGCLAVSRPQGRQAALAVPVRGVGSSASGFLFDAGMNKAFSVTRTGFSAAGRNTSNGVDLDLKARETPVFSGLFAKRDAVASTETAKPEKTAAPGFRVSADSPVTKVLSAIDPGVVPEGARNGSGADAAPASSSSRRAVQRNLTLSADDMANFRSYQVGYDIEREAGSDPDSGSAHVVAHHGKTNSAYLSPSGEYSYITDPVPRDNGIITIDDPRCGWIPERPIGGWIDLPERPIGGLVPWRPGEWIIDPAPYPFEEYDVFEDYGIDLSSDWTEYTDSDFSKVDLAYGSKLSFSVSATNAATFTVYQCVMDENGGCTLKALQTTALTYDKESGNYVATTQALLLEAGQYCLYVQSAGPAQEGDPAASYKFELNREDSDMFVDGDNTDDWTDLKVAGESGEVAYAGILDECSFDLLSDWVGFGDEIDYAGFTLDSAAKLSFSLDSTDAAKFTIYQLIRGKDGTYSLKALQTTSLTYDKEFEDYEATTKSLLLEAGEYYVSMQSTNAAQGGSAWYNIYLNDEDDATVFFTEGDNSDDWTDIGTEGPLGQVRDVGTIDENSFDILSDWVGYGDESDYAKFTLDNAAKLSFSIDADGMAKFTVYQLIRGKDGTYSLKALQSTALSYDKEFEEYAANTKSLLLEAGEYYFSVQSTNAAQGGSAWYNVYLNEEDDASDFFLDGNNSDDWTDLVTEGENGAVDDIGVLNDSAFEVRSDWVGYGDEVDYARFTLDSAAKLSFSISADDAAKFTICQLVRGKDGTYSLKALQSTTLSYDKEFEEYDATTKSLLLEAGEYYFSVRSTNAAQGGSAWYSVYLNQDEGGSEFYVNGNNLDDWTDLKTEGEYGSVGYLGYVDENSFDLASDWVGFGDAVDYMGFTLDSAAKLSFSVSADGAVKFTVCQLVRDKNDTYSLKALQTTSLSYDKEYGEYSAATKSLFLAKGDYYICVQSSDAGQGGGAWYNVYLNGDDSVFFTADDSGDNWSDLEILGPDGSVGDLGVVDEYSTELSSGWVGGKEADYAKISLYNAAKLSFSVSADGAAAFTVYKLVQDRNGKYSLTALQTTTLTLDKQTQEYDAATKALLLEAGDYYISMQSSDASNGIGYTISLNGDGSAFYTEAWNYDDWTDLKTEGESGSVSYVGTIDEYNTELVSDWVGFGDEIDYMGFTLDYAASVRFTLDATDAASFTVYRLTQTKSGMYTLSQVQTTALALNRSSGSYEAVTKALLLEAGDYYFSVRSTNAAQGGNAYYNVNVNPSDCTFYTQGWNCDDWTDLETEGASGSVGYVGAIDEYSTEDLVADWVGFGDAVDYMGFTLFNAAKLSFSVSADDAVTFTVYQLVQDRKGAYSLKTLQTTTLSSGKASEYEAVTKALLLEAGEYYFSVQSVNAPQGGGANYRVRFNGGADSFYTEGDNYDDWTNLATDGEYGDVGDIGLIDEYSDELVSGWVGFGDAVDYMKFTLNSAAKLGFTLNASDAASFAVYQLVENAGGYSLKALQTVSLAYNKQAQDYEAVTKALLLEAGDYYISVQSANAAQGGSAYYTLNLGGDSVFYTEADNWDDWTDVKSEGPCGEVGDIGVVDEYSYELASGWVGFGDAVDYAGFTLFDKANLSFSLDSTDAATFTVYSLIEGKNGTYKLKTLQTTALTYDKQLGKYVADTKALLLEAGDYYFSVQSANAAQGGSAYYNLRLNEAGSEFFPSEDDDDNWGGTEYDPSYEPICKVDPAEPEPVWTVVCGYPACDEPAGMEPVANSVDDVLVSADVFAVADAAELAASGQTVENKPLDALKELSSIA